MTMLSTCLSLLATVSSSGEPQLLKVAKLVTEVGDWQEWQLHVGQYLWWTPDEILVFKAGGKRELFDVRTKAIVPIDAAAVDYGALNLSPDRSKVVHNKWDDHKVTWTVTDRTGKTTIDSWTMISRTTPPPLSSETGHPSPYVLWSRDGKTLYQVEYWSPDVDFRVEITERRLGRLQAGHAFPIARVKEYNTLLYVHDHKALVYQFDNIKPRSRIFREWNLDEPVKTMRSWTVVAPKGLIIIEYVPSPDSSKAVWLLGEPGSDPEVGFGGFPVNSVSLWTSDLYGHNMTEIGVIPFPSKPSSDDKVGWSWFGGLDWNPDSKRVSFIYCRKLYTVLANLR